MRTFDHSQSSRGGTQNSRRRARRTLAFRAVIVGSLMLGGACSLMLDTKTQCSQDRDCAHFGYEFTCVKNVCKGAAVPCKDPSGLGDAGCIQSQVEGCVASTGPTYDQLLNGCTTAACSALPQIDLPNPMPDLPSGPPTGATAPAFALETTPIPCTIFGKPLLVVTGTDASQPLVAHLSTVMSPRVQVAFVPANSCQAYATAKGETALSGTAWYWDPTFDPTIPDARRSCTLPADGVVPSLVIADVSPAACDPGLPGDLTANWQGAVGPAAIAAITVPDRSSILAITEEVATAVFGFGADPAGHVTVGTWTNPASIFSDSAALRLVPAATAPGVWYGTWKATGAEVTASILRVGNTDEPIGMTTADAINTANNPTVSLRTLAFQAKGQGCALLPDSSRSVGDRMNVRDGHYPLWFKLRLYGHQTSGSLDPNTQLFLDLVAGKPLPSDLVSQYASFDVFSAYAKRSLVPSCAMQVSRANDADFGDLVPYTPSAGCNCHFDKALGITVPSSCVTCGSNSDCPAGSVCMAWGTASDKKYCEKGK